MLFATHHRNEAEMQMLACLIDMGSGTQPEMSSFSDFSVSVEHPDARLRKLVGG